MNVINRDLHLFDLKSVVHGNLPEQLPEPVPDGFPKDPFSILRGPHETVLRLAYRMTCALQNHAYLTLIPSSTREINRWMALKMGFHPPFLATPPSIHPRPQAGHPA